MCDRATYCRRTAVTAALLLIPVPGAEAFVSGLTSPITSGIDGHGEWVSPRNCTTPSWTGLLAVGIWNYSYRLTVPSGSVYQFLLRTSPSFTDCNIWNATVIRSHVSNCMVEFFPTPASSNPSRPPYPYLPAKFQGIKLDSCSGTLIEFSFNSPKVLIWGDFYARDPRQGTAGNCAWNAGFLTTNPTSPPSDGWRKHHVLVPDSEFGG